MNTEQFIEKAKLTHGDKYDYSLVEYVNAKTKLKIICKTCGNIFEQTPNVHTNDKCGCRICSDKKSKMFKKSTKQFKKF